MESDGPYLFLTDENGHQTVDLGISKEKGSGLILRDAKERARGVLQVTPEGEAKSQLLDVDGQPVF